MERQLEELKAKMERSGQALAGFERDLSVDQSGREDQYSGVPAAAVEHRLHQRAGRAAEAGRPPTIR